MKQHEQHLIGFARLLVMTCFVGLFVEGLHRDVRGQPPVRHGAVVSQMVPNQSVSLNPQAAMLQPRIDRTLPMVESDQGQPLPITNEIRSQIGLAAFEAPAGTENNEATLRPQLSSNPATSFADLISSQTEQFTSRDGIQSSLKVAILLAALSLAPALILMTTCYIRVVVVLSLLKQAFGGQQLPPTQVLTALSMFLTFLIMTPVWNEVKTEAIDPYSAADSTMSWDEAWQRGVVPVRNFMIRQIKMADNTESVEVFYKYLPDTNAAPPTSMSDVPLNVLLPAFMVSELKVAFLLGFQVYLPFLVLDLVVSSVTVSMGMVMLPPNMVSFPLKLILFVMVDGWNLVVGMLLQSFG